MTIFIKLFGADDLLAAMPDSILYTNLRDEKKNIYIESICLDSKMAVINSLFLCYKGPKNDGHNYIEQAVEQGATCVVIEKVDKDIEQRIKNLNIGVICVKSTADYLFALAKYKRNLMIKTKFIAITGSAGKTTVKTAIADCLKKFFVVDSTYKTYNNHFGVPLTIVNLNPECHVAVVEIGTNHVGEIEPLTNLVSPDIAIITMIGSAHVGNFPNGVEDIIKEKVSIFKGLKPGGVAILNEQNEYFKEIYKQTVALGVKHIIRVGKPESSHLYLGSHNFTNYCTTEFEVIAKEATGLKTVNCCLNGVVYHNAVNSLFSFAVARLFRVNLESIAKSVNGLSVIEGRGNIEHLFVDKKKIMIINDSYNCSFEALKASIEVLGIFKKQYPGRRTVCFLGDMAELGSRLTEYHVKMVENIISNNIDKVYCIGEGMKHLFNALPEHIKGEHFKHTGGLVKVVRSKIQDQDICLFKAKRTLGIEKAIQKLYMV